MKNATRVNDIRVALPPRGATVRDINRNAYGLVLQRSGRLCRVQFLDKSIREVFVSQLEVVRKVRAVY